MISFVETSNTERGRYIKKKAILKVGAGQSQYRKLLGLIEIILVVALSTQCGQREHLEQLEMEIHRKALEGANQAADRSRKNRHDFFMCVNDYASKNSRLSASALDIAEAAISQCQLFLQLYKSSQSHYHTSMASTNAMSLEDLGRANEIGEEKARLDTIELIEEGKRLVIKTLIEIRQ